MNKTPTRSRSYQMGAAHERQTVVAYAKRRMAELKKTLGIGSHSYTEMEELVIWLKNRTKRADARPGGLGKRKGAK